MNPVTPGTNYLIKSQLNGNVIDISGGSTAPGTGLDSWPPNGPNGSANQLWQFFPNASSPGYYLITSQLNGNAIDISGGSTANGTGLDSWPPNGPNGSANQLWELVPNPSSPDYYLIKSQLNGNVIDIMGGSTANGTGLDSWPPNGPNGSANQLWQFVLVSAGTTTTPVITSVSPATAAPGNPVVINGQGFGSQQGSGYIQIVDNGVIWGGPGNQALFAASWSDTQVTFTMPVKNSASAQLTPGTTATVSVTNGAGLTSNSADLAVCSAVNWPVSLNSAVTSIGTTGNGFVQTTVSIDQAGNLNANTQVWDTSGWGFLTGFHAATVVSLFDTFGNVIDTFPSGPYGVMGGQNFANPWTATIPANVCSQLYSVSVVNFYDPEWTAAGGISNWIVQNAPAIAKAAVAVVGAF
jgi:hypothetical protein